MSTTTTENTAPEISEEGGTAKKKLNKKLIIIILVVVLLGGAGGYFFFLRGSAEPASEKPEKETKETKETKKSNAKKESKETDDEEEKTSEKSSKSSSAAALKNALADDEDVKNVVELQPFIVNLADDEEARYLRMTVSVGIGGDGKAEKPDPIFITRVRNAMLAVLSVKTSEDVLTVKGKSKLRKELLDAAQRASEEPEVKAIYITDFIVQL